MQDRNLLVLKFSGENKKIYQANLAKEKRQRQGLGLGQRQRTDLAIAYRILVASKGLIHLIVQVQLGKLLTRSHPFAEPSSINIAVELPTPILVRSVNEVANCRLFCLPMLDRANQLLLVSNYSFCIV